jgi:ADP-heptose:LPS heptosyltransferase
MKGIISAADSAPHRPWLTATAERLLRVIGTNAGPVAPDPLASIPRRLLIVKVHGMGDSVLIRLIIEQLRRRHPAMEIGVLAGPATREILTIGTDLHVHLYSQKDLNIRSAYGSLRQLKHAGYDAMLNFEQGSIAGTAFLACTGIPIHIGFVPTGSSPKSIFLTHQVPFDEARSMWQSFLSLARVLDPELTEVAQALTIRLRPETEAWVNDWWQAHIGASEKKVVALHLGCGRGMDYRRWPVENFLALAQKITLAGKPPIILLTGTTLERPLISEFISSFSGRAVNAADLGHIEQTVAILMRCQLLVSVDTGVMHLAAGLGIPTVGLFGPNAPGHWAPLGCRATYVYDTKVTCSPCVNNYQNLMPSRCTNSEQGRCMRDISVESVVAAIGRVADAHLFE